MTLTVDLHHHVIPDFYWEASNEDGNAAGGITPPRWSLDAAIAYLDEARIDVAVPSISTPGVHPVTTLRHGRSRVASTSTPTRSLASRGSHVRQLGWRPSAPLTWLTAWQLRGVGSSEVGRVQALANAR